MGRGNSRKGGGRLRRNLGLRAADDVLLPLPQRLVQPARRPPARVTRRPPPHGARRLTGGARRAWGKPERGGGGVQGSGSVRGRDRWRAESNSSQMSARWRSTLVRADPLGGAPPDLPSSAARRSSRARERTSHLARRAARWAGAGTVGGAGGGGAAALVNQLVVPSVVDLRAWPSGEHGRGRGRGRGRAARACSRRSLAAWSDSSGVTRDSGLYPGRPSPDPRQPGVRRTWGARRRRAQRAARRGARTSVAGASLGVGHEGRWPGAPRGSVYTERAAPARARDVSMRPGAGCTDHAGGASLARSRGRGARLAHVATLT